MSTHVQSWLYCYNKAWTLDRKKRGTLPRSFCMTQSTILPWNKPFAINNRWRKCWNTVALRRCGLRFNPVRTETVDFPTHWSQWIQPVSKPASWRCCHLSTWRSWVSQSTLPNWRLWSLPWSPPGSRSGCKSRPLMEVCRWTSWPRPSEPWNARNWEGAMRPLWPFSMWWKLQVSTKGMQGAHRRRWGVNTWKRSCVHGCVRGHWTFRTLNQRRSFTRSCMPRMWFLDCTVWGCFSRHQTSVLCQFCAFCYRFPCLPGWGTCFAIAAVREPSRLFWTRSKPAMDIPTWRIFFTWRSAKIQFATIERHCHSHAFPMQMF